MGVSRQRLCDAELCALTNRPVAGAGSVSRRMQDDAQHPSPRILLCATLRWPIAARLAMAFAGLGCRVDATCPRGHPVTHALTAHRIHPYSVLRPLASLHAAIEAAAPDLVIPCDDSAAVHLGELHRGAQGSAALKALLRASLGDPGACALATARGRFMSLAAAEGLRVPHTEAIADTGALLAALSRRALPAVVKIDSTWGGLGVAIVHSREEALRAFERMASRPSLPAAVVRMLLDRDASPLLVALKAAQRSVTLQDFIPGTPANRAVACWHGRVLAGTSVAALRTQDRTGPATVVRVIDHAEMADAASRLVGRLGLSGLWGLDFVLEASTGAAHLIEMNPRATPICHLALGAGRDLPAALVAHWRGDAPAAPAGAIGHDVIAMFPGEWQRDPASRHLRDDYHDIPWDEPGLVRDCMDRPWRERGLLARLWAGLRPVSYGVPVPDPAADAPGPPVCTAANRRFDEARTTTDASPLPRRKRSSP